jgi:hypothetical protein
MAYNKSKIFEQCKKAIEDNNLYFVEDVVAYIPCSKPTFYEFFPPESNELNTLKELLDTNKVKTKVDIREKLLAGDKAAELIALYKLICSDDERKALSMQQLDITSKGDKITGIEYIIPNEDKS